MTARRYADDATVRVDERAAGVARVDGRVHLDEVGQVKASGRPRACGRSALTTPAVTVQFSPYGLPMAITSCPTRSGRGVQLRDRQPERADAQDREVDRRVGVLDAGLEATAVRQGDAHEPAAAHDMLVGQDATVGSEDDAGAGTRALAALLAARASAARPSTSIFTTAGPTVSAARLTASE